MSWNLRELHLNSNIQIEIVLCIKLNFVVWCRSKDLMKVINSLKFKNVLKKESFKLTNIFEVQSSTMSWKLRELHLLCWDRLKQLGEFRRRTPFLLLVQHYSQLLVLGLVWHFGEVGEDLEDVEVLLVDGDLYRGFLLVQRHSSRVHSAKYEIIYGKF